MPITATRVCMYVCMCVCMPAGDCLLRPPKHLGDPRQGCPSGAVGQRALCEDRERPTDAQGDPRPLEMSANSGPALSLHTRVLASPRSAL